MKRQPRQDAKITSKLNLREYRSIHWVMLGLLCVVFVIVGRLFWLQVIRGGHYEEVDLGQTEESRPLQSPRGTIYDRNGKVLAVSSITLSLYADPKMINRSPEALAHILAPYLEVSEEDLSEKLVRDTHFVWLERMLDKDKSDALKEVIKKEKLVGLNFVEESKRYYPNGDLLAQVLGFVGIDDKGLDGIEMVVDDLIKGDNTRHTIVTSRDGTPILDSTLAPFLPEKERSVYLTIDASIQFFAERALDRAMSSTKSSGGTIIVMDPRTGEILAMASRPTYDPNHFDKGSEQEFRNRAVTNLYEPGSTFKPIVAAAALSAGKVTTSTMFHDTGQVHASGHTIQNWDGEAYGDVKLEDIIKFSINTGFAELGLRTGGKVLTDYAKRFGFGKETGIELPGEGAGILFDPDEMRDSDTATMSIGQSIAVTPLQMIQAYGALANGGKMMKPHIISSIVNPDGSIYRSFEHQQVGTPITPEVDAILVPMLEKVVSEGGGAKARVSGYRLAGKTGTAQKLDAVHGGYLDGRYIASFIGFGPVERPEAVCLIVLDDPEGVYYGGQIAAPVFAEVMAQIMRYRGIHPGVREVESDAAPVSEPPMIQVERNHDGDIIIPNFAGHRLRDVLAWGDEAGIGVVPNGNGWVQRQTPEPGLTIKKGESITIYLAN